MFLLTATGFVLNVGQVPFSLVFFSLLCLFQVLSVSSQDCPWSVHQFAVSPYVSLYQYLLSCFFLFFFFFHFLGEHCSPWLGVAGFL